MWDGGVLLVLEDHQRVDLASGLEAGSLGLLWCNWGGRGGWCTPAITMAAEYCVWQLSNAYGS